jgi:hypothetical protein
MKHDNNINPTMLYAFRKAMADRNANEEISHTIREIIGSHVR